MENDIPIVSISKKPMQKKYKLTKVCVEGGMGVVEGLKNVAILYPPPPPNEWKMTFL